ncbi:immunity 49 family protein [Marinobacter sp. 1-4A]|uniref:immunity 49 family protein n=1 Tax=Marinobacter sp. 1-4A TaxID=2582919 RepID=UPI001908C6EB|nr:immunity 49 family protein [Marinobacter sp. 1-4A]MBK1851174.1 immunity 49 family protein [Marinobacter sp. 1-4A]
MIKRHHTPNIASYEYCLERYKKMLVRAPAVIQQTPRSALPTFFNSCREFFATEASVHPGSDLAWHALCLAEQLGTGHFRSVLNDGKELQLRFEDRQLPITGKYTANNTDIGVWLKVFCFGVMTRSGEALEVLNQVGEDMLLQAEKAPATKYELALAALLKGVYNPEANLARLLLDSKAAFDPDELHDSRFFYVSRILLPIDSIIRTIFAGDQEDAFNEHMEEALRLHQEYWVKVSETAEDGLVSVPLTALAVMAYDHKGYRVRVENEYIPDWVVTADRFKALTEVKPAPSGTAVFKNTPVQVKQAVLRDDYDELEAYREIDHSEWLPDLIHAFETSDDWTVRDALAYMLQDRRGDPAVKGLYEQALESPTLMIRAIALIVLHGDIDLWSVVMVHNEFNEEAVARLKGEYLSRVG